MDMETANQVNEVVGRVEKQVQYIIQKETTKNTKAIKEIDEDLTNIFDQAEKNEKAIENNRKTIQNNNELLSRFGKGLDNLKEKIGSVSELNKTINSLEAANTELKEEFEAVLTQFKEFRKEHNELMWKFKPLDHIDDKEKRLIAVLFRSDSGMYHKDILELAKLDTKELSRAFKRLERDGITIKTGRLYELTPKGYSYYGQFVEDMEYNQKE